MSEEDIILKARPNDTVCQVHDVSTADLPRALATRLRQPGGVDVCRPCADRARAEGKRRRADLDPGTTS